VFERLTLNCVTRAAASGHIASVREASQGKADAEIAAHKAALEKELDSQLATLAAEKEATMKSVEGQVSGLAKDIISKVGLSVSWSGKRSCGLHHPCVGWPLGIAHAVRRPHLCARFARFFLRVCPSKWQGQTT